MPKPTREHCREQLSRLNTKFGAPRGEEDKFRLSRVLDAMEECESDQHVTRIIDQLEQADQFPDAHDIRRFAYELRTREKRANPKCEVCNGMGFRVIDDGGQGRAGKCDCWQFVEVML